MCSLLYQSKKEWKAVPSALGFIAEVGRRLTNEALLGNRTIVALALPERAFAAAFAGLGGCLGVCSLTRVDEHLLTLRNSPLGTEVQIRSAGTKHPVGVFAGIVSLCDKEMVKIDTSSSGSHFIPVDQCLRVIITSAKVSSAKKRRRSCSDSLTPFAKTLVAPLTSEEYLGQGQSEIVIIGELGPLKYQLTEVKFATESACKGITGTLGEVIRPRELLGSGQISRSSILSTTNGRSDLTTGSVPKIVIFDGALSFFRWHSFWLHSHWIVVLSRTDSVFQEAVNTVNSYSFSSLLEQVDVVPPNCPLGVEYTQIRLGLGQ
jgi:hypothetical protein